MTPGTVFFVFLFYLLIDLLLRCLLQRYGYLESVKTRVSKL